MQYLYYAVFVLYYKTLIQYLTERIMNYRGVITKMCVLPAVLYIIILLLTLVGALKILKKITYILYVPH